MGIQTMLINAEIASRLALKAYLVEKHNQRITDNAIAYLFEGMTENEIIERLKYNEDMEQGAA